MEYLKYYTTGSPNEKNSQSSIARKVSALRSFFNYYYKKELLFRNVAMQVDMPKIHEKAIIHLEPDEVAILLDYMDQCENQLSKRQQSYFRLTKQRDIAIVTLFLGTGIRVSECVGLDITDINFRENSLRVQRKGGNEAILYFGSEVEHDYLITLTVSESKPLSPPKMVTKMPYSSPYKNVVFPFMLLKILSESIQKLW